MSKKYYLGYDIGGTKCAVILGEEPWSENGKPAEGSILEESAESGGELTILARKEIPTDHTVSPYVMLDRLTELSREAALENEIEIPDVISCGVSCGGPLNSKEGLILSPPNLLGWDRVPVVSYLKEKLGMPVALQNDANAGALAEWRYGAAKGYKNVIFLTFGTGFGAGLILDGRLYSGTNDLAGEVGHIRIAEHGPVGFGKEGSMEGFCSGGGLARLAQTKALEQLQQGKRVSFYEGTDAEGLSSITAKDVALAAHRGDKLAKEVYDISAEYLGRGLALLIDLLNPEVIVIGSVYARNEELFRDRVQKVIAREALSLSAGVCKIVPAALSEQIGDYAALAVAALAA